MVEILSWSWYYSSSLTTVPPFLTANKTTVYTTLRKKNKRISTWKDIVFPDQEVLWGKCNFVTIPYIIEIKDPIQLWQVLLLRPVIWRNPVVKRINPQLDLEVSALVSLNTSLWVLQSSKRWKIIQHYPSLNSISTQNTGVCIESLRVSL